MANNTSLSEHKFLVSAENDIVLFGKTTKKCPRCGNDIILQDHGASYVVRCASNNCIKAEYSGI